MDGWVVRCVCVDECWVGGWMGRWVVRCGCVLGGCVLGWWVDGQVGGFGAGVGWVSG
jgi:hypothetical protein